MAHLLAGSPSSRAASLALVLAAGCAHHPATPRLERAGGPGYRLAESSRPGQSEELLVVLAFSGGGMRAAALGYGALEELRRTEVTIDGRRRRLLDEVDVITAISGGTLPAAYYGLRGEATFEEFGPRVLSRDLERALVWRILSPSSWFRLPSGTFNRSDLFAELYDETVFGGATFADLGAAGGPFVLVHGTDVSTGARFTFTQEQFDAICGDLSKVTLGRAVATSTALPPLLPPITLENRAGTCGWAGPPWLAAAEAAASGGDTPGRAVWRARALKSYQPLERPFVHLFDGGLSENLGLTEVASAFDLLAIAPDAPALASLRRARKVVVIAVNALRFPEVDWDRSAAPPGTDDLRDQMWSIPVDRLTLDALEKVREQLERWRAEAPGERQAYLASVTFDSLTDAAERHHFNQVKTSLALPAEEVDRLREVSGRLLREAPAFQRLLADLRSPPGVADGAAPPPGRGTTPSAGGPPGPAGPTSPLLASAARCRPSGARRCHAGGCEDASEGLHAEQFELDLEAATLGACLYTDCYGGKARLVRDPEAPWLVTGFGEVRSERPAEGPFPRGSAPFPLTVSVDLRDGTFSAVWSLSPNGLQVDFGRCELTPPAR